MLRKFRIKINEKEYMVEMEEFGAPAVAAAPVQAAPAPVAAPTIAAAAPVAPAPVVGSGEGDPITAPMPGKSWTSK